LTRQLHAAEVVGRLGVPELSSGRLARELQQHVVLVPPKARQKLLANGKARFAHPKLRGDQFAVLEALDLYHEDSGLWWENAEYLALEAAII
jgi:CRISPR-associated endonuclease/helicase Cas3